MKTSVRAAVVAALVVFASPVRALEVRVAVPPAPPSAPLAISYSAMSVPLALSAPAPAIALDGLPNLPVPPSLSPNQSATRTAPPAPIEADAARSGASFDGLRPDANAGTPVDPPFYGQQAPDSGRPRTRPYAPSSADVEQARREYLTLAEAGEEIFNAPTWFEKGEYPRLKKAIFSVALIDEALTDIANDQKADVPIDLEGDIVSALLVRRSQVMAAYRVEIARISAELNKVPWTATRARNNARIRLERWHQLGLVAPALEKTPESLPPEYRLVAETYQKMREIAAGRQESSQEEVNALAELYDESLRSTLTLKKARALDIVLSAASKSKASPGEAKAIYERSLREARDRDNSSNMDHLSAMIASGGITLVPVPRSGKQIRPTCTMHMLASLLASLGVKRDLTELIREARLILNDPFVGITTAFNYKQQLKLFRHYGRISEVRGNLFESLIVHRRALKISIEIGDPVYKHSLIVKGFYELDGKTYIALVDSTSYFATHMTVEDFAKVLTADDAVIFLEALPPQPR